MEPRPATREAEQSTLLVSNIGAMKSVPEPIQKRHIAHFKRADREYGEQVEKGLAAAPAGDPRRVSVVR